MTGPLAGRKLWFVGIGGAGLSAYAQLARAWGAEVGGWDRVETPYLAQLRDVRVELAPEPVVPPGFEAVVSSAYPDVPGLRRREFLRELVSLRPAIVVAGSHGKGTTAAMIAYVLREAGRDPAWLIGAPVPQLGANAGAGGGYLVVEGRRVRPHRVLAPGGDRRGHEHRARPSQRVRVARRAGKRVRRLARDALRRSCATHRRTRARSRCPAG